MPVARFDPKGRLIYLEVRVVGPGGHYDPVMALDTGASRTILSERLLRRIGFDPAVLPRTGTARTAGGDVPAGRVRLRQLTAIGITVPFFEVAFHPFNPNARAEGLLGLDFFRGYRFTVDLDAGWIDLRRPGRWWRVWEW